MNRRWCQTRCGGSASLWSLSAPSLGVEYERNEKRFLRKVRGKLYNIPYAKREILPNYAGKARSRRFHEVLLMSLPPTLRKNRILVHSYGKRPISSGEEQRERWSLFLPRCLQ